MHELDDLAGQLDVAVAVNSLVMPDVRLIDRTLRSIRASLRPGGQFLGVVPSIDTICYHLMLLMDQSLDQGLEPKEAKRLAALHAERRYYDFAFGEFHFEGLRQKFWQPFELEYRLTKAGFTSTTLGKVLYPWDESLAGSESTGRIPAQLGLVFPGAPDLAIRSSDETGSGSSHASQLTRSIAMSLDSA